MKKKKREKKGVCIERRPGICRESHASQSFDVEKPQSGSPAKVGKGM